MELLLGSHVREHGNRVGRLAGFELEPATRAIRRIIFSQNGELGPDAVTRPLVAISLVHDDGEIELRPETTTEVPPSVPDAVLLNRATRVRPASGGLARLAGVEVNPADRSIVSVYCRQHWWSRRAALAGDTLDFSTPGEIRSRPTGHGSRAA